MKNETVCIRLKECRVACGYTQKEVAESLGVSQPVYSRYETGVCGCTYIQLAKLCDLFDVSADYILGRVDFQARRVFSSFRRNEADPLSCRAILRRRICPYAEKRDRTKGTCEKPKYK